MYGNVETALDKAWGPGEGCPQVSPPEEDPYEPLDPSPSAGPAPPARPAPSRRPRPLLVALVALVALVTLVTLLLGTLGARRISVLEAALEAEKAKEPPPPAGSASFLLYNQHHSGCVVPSGRALSLSRCVPSSPSQRFQWLPGGLLRHVGTGLCAAAAAAAERALVLLEPCRERRERRQRWECGPGALLRLAGTEPPLHFNFGHERHERVMLYPGQGEWSRWLVHGTEEDVCSRDCFPPCSQGWTFFRNSCYFFSQSVTSWDNSHFFCSALGSQLLEVDDAEEKLHVQAQLRGPAWLGIRDRDQEGTWTRGDGTALTPNSSWWHWGEPNGGSLENCAAVGPDGLWADYPCGTPLAWVCEGPS